MKRDSFDDGREPRPEGKPGRYVPCSVCNEATAWPTLSAFGARCKPCFDAYCERPTRVRPLPEGVTIPADVPHLHRWAYRLMARRAAGQPLNNAQQHCIAEFERRQGIGKESQL
jgi:hypothetical protein